VRRERGKSTPSIVHRSAGTAGWQPAVADLACFGPQCQAAVCGFRRRTHAAVYDMARWPGTPAPSRRARSGAQRTRLARDELAPPRRRKIVSAGRPPPGRSAAARRAGISGRFRIFWGARVRRHMLVHRGCDLPAAKRVRNGRQRQISRKMARLGPPPPRPRANAYARRVAGIPSLRISPLGRHTFVRHWPLFRPGNETVSIPRVRRLIPLAPAITRPRHRGGRTCVP
jgi:hypothetical protein